MSDITITSSTYAGENALEYISAALTTADSLANGYVTIMENVKFKQVLNVFSNDGALIQDFGCDWVTAGQLTLAERVLTVTELMVNLEFCKEQFRSSWQALQTGRGFINDELPSSIESFILLYVAGIIQEAIEYNLWQGNYDASGTTYPYEDFNGVCQILEADAGTIDVDLMAIDGTTPATAFTSGEQVVTNLNLVMNAMTTPIRNKDRFRFFVSRKTQDFYLQRLSELGTDYKYFSNDGSSKFLYNGYEVVAPAGFPDDTILYAESANLFFGTDVVGDFNQAVVIDRTQIDGSDNVRVAFRFTGGVQVGVTANCIMCFPDAAV